MSTNEADETVVVLADLEVERRLLGAMIVDNGLVERLGLPATDFHDESHRAIWEGAERIIERGELVSVAVLAAALPAMKNYIARLPELAVRGAAAIDCARTVRDFAARRRIAALAAELQERAGDTGASAEEIMADAMAKLSAVPVGKEAQPKHLVAEAVLADLDRPTEIFPTGLAPLDEAMGGGLIAGRLYGIGARKKVGKSLLLGTISHNLNRARVPHLFVTLEMSAKEIEQRNIGREQGFNAIRFLTRDLPDLHRRVGEYAATVPRFAVYEHAPGATFGTLRSIIGRARLKGIKGVVLDYLQLVGGKGRNETEEYHHRRVAQWLADMGRQTGLWVLVAAQLNQDDNVRGGEGLRLACDQYYSLHRNKGETGAWLEMEETRYTLYQSVGTETLPALWLRKHGPHFSDEPPPLADPLLGDVA